MKIEEAIDILKKSNKWRRGARVKMPDPKEFVEAIDFAISSMEVLQNVTKNIKNGNIKF